MQGCKALFESFVQYSMQSQLVPGQTGCAFQYGSTEYLASPCCNTNMQQCCAPQAVNITLPVLSGTRTSVIAATCAHPSKVATVLNDFIAIQQQQSSLATTNAGGSDFWQKYSAFQSTCQQKIYNQKCTSSAECLSSACDRRNGQCVVPWGSEAPLLARCYYANMLPELRSEWKAMWCAANLRFREFFNESSCRTQ